MNPRDNGERHPRRHALAWCVVLGTISLAALLVSAGDSADPAPPLPAEKGVVAPESLPEGKTCLDCHAEVVAKKNVHAPSRTAADCASCHLGDGKLHKFRYPLEGGKLCLDCHQDMKLEGTVHEPVKAGECSKCHDPHGSDQPRLLLAPQAELCAGCHEKLKSGRKKEVHGPFAAGACTSCHMAHASPNAKLLARAGSELCLQCHEQIIPEDKAATWHQPVREDCTACHSGHESDERFMLKEASPTLCFGCHKPLAQQMEGATVRHKAVTEGSGCSGCHEPHVSSYGKMLRTDLKALCLTCHDRTYPQASGPPLPDFKKVLADNPNLHGPVKESNCDGCHVPHAGANFRLLKEPYPARFYAPFSEDNYKLCFTCHKKEVVLNEKSKLTNFRDGERNLHFLHVNRAKGRTCRACHETHASRNDHHIRDTTLFGTWQMEVKYRKLPEGGSCAPGCHVEKSYRRND